MEQRAYVKLVRPCGIDMYAVIMPDGKEKERTYSQQSAVYKVEQINKKLIKA